MNFTCNQAFQEAHNIFLWRDSNLIQIIEYPTKVLAWKMAQYFSINLKGRGWLNTPVTFSPLESSTETTCKKNCKPRLKNKLKHDEIIIRSPTPEKQYFWKISRTEEQIMEFEISLLKSIITTWILHIASLLMDEEYFFEFGSLPLR